MVGSGAVAHGPSIFLFMCCRGRIGETQRERHAKRERGTMSDGEKVTGETEMKEFIYYFLTPQRGFEKKLTLSTNL